MALPLNFMTIPLLDNHIDMPSIRNGTLSPALHGTRSKGVNGVSVTALPVTGNGVSPPVGVATAVSISSIPVDERTSLNPTVKPNTLLIYHF